MIIISQEIKEKILSVSKIEDIIGSFIKLKKTGINYRGFSPFSEERNPSLIVSPTKKIWKDFSSGKGGDVINFLMYYEKFTYVESLLFLAKKYNIKISNSNFLYKNNNKEIISIELLDIQNYATKFFIQQMFNTKEGIKYGLNYLTKQRKYKIEIIRKFQIGYAPIYYKALTNIIINKEFKLNNLIISGCIISKGSNYFDRFRKRIMFPIHDLSGNIVGFGGRALYEKNNICKYINSPESEVFHKGNLLYGLFQSKKYIIKNDICYLVEGYTDVISLYQVGIKNVVSSSGISLTTNQILLIKKFTQNIILFYDGDNSGIKATLRVMNLILEQGMNLRIIFFPNGEDPDTISKKYSSLFSIRKFLLKHIYNFVSFKDKIYKKFHNNDPITKYNLVINILNSISKINNIIQRELYIQETSRLLNISKSLLINEFKKIMKKNNFLYTKKNICENVKNIEKNNVHYKESCYNLMIFIENKIIYLILNYGNYNLYSNLTVFEKILIFIRNWKIKIYLLKNRKIFYELYMRSKINSYSSFIERKKNITDIPLFKRYLQEILLKYKSLYLLKIINQEVSQYYSNNKNSYNKYSCFIKRIMYLTKIRNKIQRKLHIYV